MKTSKVLLGALLAILSLVASQIGAELVASLFHMPGLPLGFCNIIAGASYLLLAYLLLRVLSGKYLHMDMAPRFSIKVKWFVVAVLLPAAVKGVFLLLPGEFVSSEMTKSEMFTTLSAGIMFTGIAAGFVEEMVFRGVIMGLLKERWNTAVAIFVPSVLFAAVHLIGMDFTLTSCLLVLVAGTMVGIMFSLIALEGNSVWNSGIVHALWNIVIIGGGLAIGGEMDEYSVMTYVLQSKSLVLTGGEFGIESSGIALVGYLVVTTFTLCLIKRAKGDRSESH
ncbi:MAG: type II CAAX endopeptidase family protein [Lachnospiraceae bacterium]|nr:type II CAAX endopeptidase family protein [Lachnospiraceae bacterium]